VRSDDECQSGDGVIARIDGVRERLSDDPTARQLAQTFKALSDPTRVRIISVLSHNELCVHEIADCLGMSQSAISHQLRTLLEMHLVRFRKEGRHVHYSLDDEHISVLFQCGLNHVEHD
jgi:ArsR family transcriptional regulator